METLVLRKKEEFEKRIIYLTEITEHYNKTCGHEYSISFLLTKCCNVAFKMSSFIEALNVNLTIEFLSDAISFLDDAIDFVDNLPNQMLTYKHGFFAKLKQRRKIKKQMKRLSIYCDKITPLFKPLDPSEVIKIKNKKSKVATHDSQTTLSSGDNGDIDCII